jgi:hypothetical protein
MQHDFDGVSCRFTSKSSHLSESIVKKAIAALQEAGYTNQSAHKWEQQWGVEFRYHHIDDSKFDLQLVSCAEGPDARSMQNMINHSIV